LQDKIVQKAVIQITSR